ncbi:YicC/YloC family endoribonuclease [Listeria ilorinensis]|uniref:YicC/YloC family endoribonuclease n=1 Tax=Listeria ilorinensis TaxID=2867439 RepID=UPI001EF5CC71|nr:YicC/YloC family endoribonuclease [Listeria ilorinensis]
MVKSMTGFGRASQETADFKVTVELKAVNHRYLECLFRMPRQFNFLEGNLKKMIARTIRRGRVECFFSVEGTHIAKQSLIVDWDLADHYYRFLKKAKARYPFESELTMQDFLTDAAYLEVKEAQEVSPELEPLFLKALEKAVKRLDDMRQTEGNELALHFKTHLATLQQALLTVEEELPKNRLYYEEKLRARLEQIAGTEFDQHLLFSELALMLEKADINEEIERLGSHIKQFEAILLKDEPVGRKLDFLIQEMNREVNTIGSKAQMLIITEKVVEMKTTLEKIREQVQNVE